MTDIQPPDEIKTIVDKTSNFVARLGIDFEKRIYENEKENPKFGFLTPGDVYHNYYQQRLAYFRAELASAGTLIATQSAATSFQNSAEPPPAPPPSPPKEDIVKEETIAASEAPKHGPHSLAWRIWQIEKQVKQGELIPDPPIPFQFVQEIPNELTPLDLDIIRLTAQFVARNGQQFQMGLMNREIKNPQFEFLKPGNELHGYFLGLVESYTRCLLPSKGLLEKLKNEYLNEKQNIITKLILRYEFDKEQQRKQKELEEKEKEESIAASIDWHDYVIVETISFEDEQPNNNNNNYNKRMEVSTTEDISMDTEDMEMEIEEVKRPPSEMRIKKDYVKPTLQGMAMNSRKLQRCPKCGQDIPVEEMEEHMRIELLDPRYVQQRAQLIDKSRTASGASNEEITKNIGAFARRRTDIFGDDEEFEIGKTHDADAANKSNNNDDKVIWDGHTASIPAVTTKKINEQIAAIHASKGFQTTPSTSTSTSTTPDTIQQQQQINNNNNNVTSNTQITPPIPVTNRNIMPPQPPQPPLPTMTAPPPMPYEEPLSKRQKVIENDTPLDLVPEQQWLQRFPNKSISIAIQCPQDDKSEGKLTGQTITIKINMNDTVTTLKEKLKEQVAIPPNKQKLKGSGYHLKDDKTLAYYNFTDGTIVQLAKRERGGKR